MPNIYHRITKFNEGRLPEMLQIKYKTMSANVFSFYRGTCHLFYEDLYAAKPLPVSPLTWICGDLHMENFGSYKGDNHVEYFDLNDFDEAILAPAAWELARMVTCIFIAFESLGIEYDKAVKMAELFLRSYSATLSKGKAISLDPRTANGIVCTFLTAVEKRKQKQLLKKRTIAKKGKLKLSLDHKNHFELDKSLKKELAEHINEWIKTSNDGPYNYEVIDSVFRLAGNGSVGVKRYLFLLKSLNTKDKYLLLDMKEALPSSLSPYIKIKQPAWGSEAERVVLVQQRMQNVLPALLGTTIFNGQPFVLGQMQPSEDKINFELIKDRYREIYRVIDDMAMLTASTQLRSSGRQGSATADDLIAFGENAEWKEPILKYAMQYARKVKKDYQQFIAGFEEGKYA